MNHATHSYDEQAEGENFAGRDPLDAIAGLMWGSLMGSAIWLSALSIALRT